MLDGQAPLGQHALLELEAVPHGGLLVVRSRMVQLEPQTDGQLVVALDVPEELVLVLKEADEFDAVHQTLVLVCGQIGQQIGELGENLLWATLFESFADKVLPAGEEAGDVRLDNTDLLKEVIESKDDAHGLDIMQVVQLDHHVAVVLNCSQAHGAVVEEVSDSAMFYLILSQLSSTDLFRFFIFRFSVSIIEHDTKPRQITRLIDLVHNLSYIRQAFCLIRLYLVRELIYCQSLFD